jgi:DNA-directed RNA polymerase subunit N
MLIPVRCFTCGAIIGDKYEAFAEKLKNGEKVKEALDNLKVTRYCCRRMLLSHKELIDEIIEFDEKGLKV